MHRELLASNRLLNSTRTGINGTNKYISVHSLRLQPCTNFANSFSFGTRKDDNFSSTISVCTFHTALLADRQLAQHLGAWDWSFERRMDGLDGRMPQQMRWWLFDVLQSRELCRMKLMGSSCQSPKLGIFFRQECINAQSAWLLRINKMCCILAIYKIKKDCYRI